MVNLTLYQLRTTPAWEISRWLLPWRLLRCVVCPCLHCFTTQFVASLHYATPCWAVFWGRVCSVAFFGGLWV